MKRLPLVWKPMALAAMGLLAASCADPTPTPFLPGPLSKPEAGDGSGESAWNKAPVKPGAITRMDVTTLFPMQQTGAVALFDTRPALFYHMGHIPGARSWPKNQLETRQESHEAVLAAAARDHLPVVLYCTNRECPDARAVAERISACGYSVAIFEEGYEGWKAAGLPTQ